MNMRIFNSTTNNMQLCYKLVYYHPIGDLTLFYKGSRLFGVFQTLSFVRETYTTIDIDTVNFSQFVKDSQPTDLHMYINLDSVEKWRFICNNHNDSHYESTFFVGDSLHSICNILLRSRMWSYESLGFASNFTTSIWYWWKSYNHIQKYKSNQ